jgi:hypothetical protein
MYALYPGTDPEMASQLIIVEAFYDSSSFIPGRSPGADEALSVAGLLQLAERLARHPPNRPFLLIASGGHAQGLAGMRETIWAATARSKDLREMDRQLKSDEQQRESYLEVLEQYRRGRIEDSGTKLLQEAVNQALKLRVDALSGELMRLRLHEEEENVADRIRMLARQRFALRQLGWIATWGKSAATSMNCWLP